MTAIVNTEYRALIKRAGLDPRNVTGVKIKDGVIKFTVTMEFVPDRAPE